LYPWVPENINLSERLVKKKKLIRNASSTNPSKIIMYKMFEEIVGSQLISQPKIREGKNEAKSAFLRLIDALEDT
jgi:hypothetical protein